jgi:putative acetyltransferase
MTATPRPALVPDDYPQLVAVWRSAVRATHDFLTPADLDAIEAVLIPSYFPNVSLHVLEEDGHILGFSGVTGAMLEMLFVDASARGNGVGRILLDHAIGQLGATRVDVNEQNGQATGFYLHHGFTVSGRSDVDGDGRPYPLLHLTLDHGSVVA